MMTSSMEDHLLLIWRSTIQHERGRTATPLEAPDNGKPYGGGAAKKWSPEWLRRHDHAAADEGARRQQEPEGMGEGKEAEDDQFLTLVV